MKIDYIIKLGGSLLYDFQKTKKLLEKLYLDKSGNFAVTIGSGKLGEIYKSFLSDLGDDKVSFNDSVRNYSNVQSINASVLASLNNNYVVCTNQQEVNNVLEKGGIPILDSRGFMHVFQNNKYQRGDVRAANLCNYFDCNTLIIITNVNGVYDKDPKKNPDSHILKVITPDELETMGRTSVDDGLAEKIRNYNLNCYVLGIDCLLNTNCKMDDDVFEMGTKIKGREKVYEKKN